MIPVLVALADRRQRILEHGDHATGTPAREILDRWAIEDRTPTPGTHTSARVNARGIGSGSPTVPALVDPETRCPIEHEKTDTIGFHAVVLRVLPDADAPTVADFHTGRRSAHHYGGTP